MSTNEDKKSDYRRQVLWMLVLVAAAAIIMGLPTLRGGFVGGDDHRLVLNHVLVNHPSWEHAVKLFGMIHRDLYQPLPLLSFQAEFALADLLGLFDEGIEGGAWLLHLTNILLHAINAVLVWLVIRVLHRGTERRSADMVATVAAVLYAIHPLEVEVVAWINGRMMLLSTLFALAAVATLAKWLQDKRTRWAVLTVVLVTLCSMSKIRVGVPLLLVIALLALEQRVDIRFAVLWVVCVAITAVLAVINYIATAGTGMFSGAEEQLHGPMLVRVLLGLAWYFQHFVWPTGLASWYPTPVVVSWSDSATIRAMIVLSSAAVLICWLAIRWRPALWGFAWFFVTMAVTVHLVSTRNALAADRYMYLPIIGLLWVAALVFTKAYERACDRWARAKVRGAVIPVAILAAVVLIGQSWHTAAFYETPTKKSLRIAELHPMTPYVWERVAWSFYRAGRYAEAIEHATREMVHERNDVRSAALQVIGMSKFRLGDPDTAMKMLREAVDLAPEDTQAKYYVGEVLEQVGRDEEALPWYEQTVASAPLANPRKIRLAALYRRLGRHADARKLYEEALLNNEYDVAATQGLAELDIETGTKEAYYAAARRLTELLEWMPENADAWVNLGVARRALGQTGGAIEAYRRALEEDPRQATAALNLAVLYQGTGDIQSAATLYDEAAECGLESVVEVSAVHDFYIAQGAAGRAVALWDEFLVRFPESVSAQAFRAWSRLLAGDLQRGMMEARQLVERPSPHPLGIAALALAALLQEEYAVAMDRGDQLCASGSPGAEARQRLLQALQLLGGRRPDVAWTYCLASELLLAENQMDQARLGMDLCAQLCAEPTCRDRVKSLQERLSSASGATGETPPNAP